MTNKIKSFFQMTSWGQLLHIIRGGIMITIIILLSLWTIFFFPINCRIKEKWQCEIILKKFLIFFIIKKRLIIFIFLFYI